MKDQPLVSVVMIFLNEERFIEEAIQSVLAQTTGSWELLLIDDGSTDASTRITQQYAQRHRGKVRYLEHQAHRNLGKSVSRNLGIEAARGDLIAFLDGDDIFLPQKLERQAAILESHPAAAMVYGSTCYWHSWTGKTADCGRDRKANLGVHPDRLFEPPFLLRLFLQDGGTVPATCGLLVRRQAAIDAGGFEEAVHDLFEDQVFLAKISVKFPVFVESGCWDKYRQRSDSSSKMAIKSGKYHRWGPNPAHRLFLSWLENYLREERIADKDLRKILNRRLWPYKHPSLFRLRDRVLGRTRRRIVPPPSSKKPLVS